MWRVLLSISAVVVDVVIFVGMIFGFIGLTEDGPAGAAGTASAPVSSDQVGAFALMSVIAAAMLLNVLAIAFGARLRGKTVPSPDGVAAEFS
jgi:hypothetical protein